MGSGGGEDRSKCVVLLLMSVGPDESPCHSLFSATQYEEMRNACRELCRDELDLVIMRELRSPTFRDLITWRNEDEGRRQIISYYQFGGHPVCKNTFCFLHNIGISKLNAIKASWLKNGLRPRERKHTTAHNATKFQTSSLSSAIFSIMQKTT